MVTVPTFYGTMRAYEVISGSDGLSYNSGSGGTDIQNKVVHMVYFYQILEQYY